VGYHLQANVALDNDGDGAKEGPVVSTCVGPALSETTGFTHYKAPDGQQYVDVATSRGYDDCDASNPLLYRRVLGGYDADTDRIVGEAGPTLRCVGESVPYNGTTLYFTVEGGYGWLDVKDIKGYNDCDDSNAAVWRIVSGGTDMNHDGIVAEGKATSRCVGASSLLGGRTYYNIQSLSWLDAKDIQGYNDPHDY
jgi:hypothetical protein